MALLINQLDEHNESGIIYLIKNKIEEVLFLYRYKKKIYLQF